MRILFLCYTLGTIALGLCGTLLAYLYHVNFFVGLSICVSAVFTCSILIYRKHFEGFPHAITKANHNQSDDDTEYLESISADRSDGEIPAIHDSRSEELSDEYN